MPPSALTLPMSTEINMQKLMNEASMSLDLGKYKSSFELYIEALLLAVKEFQQVQFKNQCMVMQQTDLSNTFLLAETCLKQAKDITFSKKISSPPVVPPKPSALSKKLPPPLPSRPTAQPMLRSKSDFVEKCNIDYTNIVTDYSDDDEEIEADTSLVEGKDFGVNISLKKDQQYFVNKPQRKPTIIRRKSNKLKRRSSTSNLTNTMPSSSSLIAGNPLNVMKSFLSLPSAIATHTVLDGDDIFLLSNSTIDPNVLITVQTSHSDNSLQSVTTVNNNYLPMIPQAPLVTVYQSLQKRLEEVKKTDEQFNNIQSLLNRVRNIHMSATTVPTILQFQPVLIAYQLTLIESAIFRNVSTDAILSHSPKTPHPTIVASTDFFNYLTRLIEHAILLQQDASGRAQHINHWIKVAGKCHELKNYQTLKAVISALGTPPIQRLKRSWSFIPKKSMNLLEDLGDLMSEASNYGKYRTRLGLQSQECQVDEPTTRKSSNAATNTINSSGATINTVNTNTANGVTKRTNIRKNSFSEPTVPFLGIFIHDMTYLIAALSKKKYDHNSQWISTNNNNTPIMTEKLQQDARVSELLKLFKNLQRSPPYSPNLSAGYIKDLNKNRKRKLSHALTRTSAIKKTPSYFSNQQDDELSIEMQQCLVTQYLLTRSWVSEKTVDELSLVREPTKRSYSVTDSLASAPNFSSSSTTLPAPPPITSSVSLTTTTRSSSGSLTSSSSNSRPLSLDDDIDDEVMERKGSIGGGSFWLFGRKSVDQGNLKSSSSSNGDQFGTLTRSPRHFSFEDLNSGTGMIIKSNSLKKQQSSLSIDSNTVKMQREGSQSSLASSIFKKDFWKNSGSNNVTTPTSGRNPLLNFHSDPSMLTSISIPRKDSTSSLVHPSPSTSSETHNHHNLRKKIHIASPHPLDNSPSTTATPQSEFGGFQWDQ